MLGKSCLAVLAAAALAAPAAAETHEVMMFGSGYFPVTIYAAPGDSVEFVNRHELPMTATAKDGTWTTGPLLLDQRATVPVVDGMTMDYDNTVIEVLGTDLLAVGDLQTVTGQDLVTGRIEHVEPAPLKDEASTDDTRDYHQEWDARTEG